MEANLDKVKKKLSDFAEYYHLVRWFYEKYFQEHRNPKSREQSDVYFYKDHLSYKCFSNEFVNSFFAMTGYISHMKTVPMTLLYARARNIPPIPGTLALCGTSIDTIDSSFVDYYKAHVMLQVVTLVEKYNKQDPILGMLCSLFVDNSNSDGKIRMACHSSPFLMTTSKHYYDVAKLVLAGRITCCETDRFLMVI